MGHQLNRKQLLSWIDVCPTTNNVIPPSSTLALRLQPNSLSVGTRSLYCRKM